VDLHVNFTHINETEAKYEVSQVNVRVERGSTLTFARELSYIASNIFTRVTNEIKAMYRRSSVHVQSGAPNDNFRKNICSEDDLRSRIFGTFVVKFFACLPLLGFSKI